MRKILGIICLILALLAGVKLAARLATGGVKPKPGASASYNRGYQAGAFLAPVIMGLLALWLLNPSDYAPVRPRRSPGSGGDGQSSFARRALFAILWMAVGGMVVLVLAVVVVKVGKRNRFRPPPVATMPDSRRGSMPPSMGPPSRPSAPAETFKVGQVVEGYWAGEWMKGTVTDVRPYFVMVKFEDTRYPHPLGLQAHRVRSPVKRPSR
jgi:hypothetical protein